MAKTASYRGKAGIGISVNFNSLLEKIKEAEGDIEAATWEAARKGAKVMYDELQAQCSASGVPASVSNAITFQAERDNSGNRFACKVGWRVPDYDPKNPSPAHKAIFLNYGTPHRQTESGADRGYMDGKGFIGRAKKKARPKIKKAQEDALTEILEGLPKK